LGRKIGSAVIDRGIELELVLHIGAFRRPARDADRPGACELRKLADQRTDRPACRGDHDGFAGIRSADRPET
jgi:hypothetical protein